MLLNINISHLSLLVCFFLFSVLGCNNIKQGKYWDDTNVNKVACREYENGVLLNLTYYNSDKKTKNGYSYNYSLSGDTLRKAYYHNDTLVGNYYEFYSSLRPKKYICFDMYGKPIFTREYNGEKKIIKETGELIKESGIFKSDLEKDSIIEFVSMYISPPSTSILMNKYIIYSRNKYDTIYPIDNFLSKEGTIHTSKFKIKERGVYIFYNPIIIHDSIANKIYTQDESFEMRL